MLHIDYQQLLISETLAEKIALDYYGVVGTATAQAGEIDFNFKITCADKSYILKVSRPDVALSYLDFQDKLLAHIEAKKPDMQYPKSLRNASGVGVFDYTDTYGKVRKIRLLEWVDGRLYSAVNPKTEHLRYTLGQRCGQVTACLADFDHALSVRTFDWDLANALWVENYLHLFDDNELGMVQFFVQRFKNIQPQYQQLRKSTIHNDANDNNIVVSSDMQHPNTEAIIDYGDAVYSQIINDVSVVLAYGIMDCEQPLDAAKSIVAGYHDTCPLRDDELKVLYVTTAMRLVISVTKSAINKQKEPDNTYLLISEKSAWKLLEQWKNTSEDFAYYTFRGACGWSACAGYDAFVAYAQAAKWEISDLIAIGKDTHILPIDLSIASPFVGNFSDYQSEALTHKIKRLITEQEVLLVGGYGEPRPIYTTDAYKIVMNEGYEHRTIHLGVDFWIKANTPVYAIEDGVILSVYNNDHPKDYGPTIILRHEVSGTAFYTLYGHLTRQSLADKHIGQVIKKGEKIAEIGHETENGDWAPHLHFQIILDMLGQQHDFFGVSSPTNWPIFSSICPNPNLLFKSEILQTNSSKSLAEQIAYRKQHLGKSLSLSYDQPLKIVRGEMQYLIDDLGQKYIDTVNNVAHVGHEHPTVVSVGQAQMAVLNTNTRYLNDEILQFAEALLQTFPPSLSVLHFVNSGSEANELALRMAKAVSGQRDIIAVEVGYHGNTQGCIDISSYKFNGKGGQGCPEHTHIVPLPDAFRGMYRGQDSGPKYAQHVQAQIEKLQSENKNVAGFIAESIISCGGQIDLPSGYLAAAYQYVRAAGGVCISDEVQVGFGRVGKAFWGFQLHDVVPDIVTMGKPIGNGHPLAAVVCTRAVADAFANGMEYFNTFGGNPVSCAIGQAVLTTIKTDKLQEHALQVGQYLKTKLLALQKDFPIIADIRGEGLFLGIELTDSQLQPLPYQTNYLANRMKAFRILMSIDGPDHNVLKIKPPMCFSLENADYLLATMRRVLAEDAMTKF